MPALFERAVTSGRGFYRWQRRLLDDWFLQGRVPRAVDVPTGLGKTKVMAAWLVARALGAPLPRRLVYVVDRRAVVDQATSEADALVQAVRTLLEDPGVPESERTSWRSNLGLAVGEPLPVSTLRGQFVDNRLWMDRPHGCAIVVGTVDMIGSRLLFSGYGVSRGMRPVHAGLLGCDAYLVLDEAHLVPPFEMLLEQVAEKTERDRDAAPVPCVPRFALTALSATGRTTADAPTFRLDEADASDPPVAARLHAEKRLFMLPQVEVGQLAAALAERALELSAGNRRILVFSNSRKIAQEVEALLSARCKREYGNRELTALLVGERRVRERLAQSVPAGDAAAGPTVLQRFLPLAHRAEAPPPDAPFFLVATSAGEVGIDLDADDIVCDLVPWERMVQRFGRVNRRPEPGLARIVVVPSLSEKDAENSVAVEQLANLRAPFESAEWTVAPDGSRDASPAALQRLKEKIGPLLEAATTEAPHYPELEPATVDAWALTSLNSHPGRPIVGPWLRGWEENRPQTTLVWRTHFPLRRGWQRSFEHRWDQRRAMSAEARAILADLEGFFEAAPPDVSEMLEAPTDRVVALIKKRVAALADVGPDAQVQDEPEHEPVIVVLDAANDVETLLTLGDARKWKTERLERALAERTVVLDGRIAGLAESGLLDDREETAPITVDERDGDEARWWGVLGNVPTRRIRFGVRERPSERFSDPWKSEGFRWLLHPDDPASQQLWVEVRRDRSAAAGDAAVTRRSQALGEHLTWTHDDAARAAQAFDLPPEKRLMLQLAARLHDTGKNRELWQDAMNATRGGRPYAKTTGGATPGALGGYRHEFGSLADAQKDAEVAALAPGDRDLVLHLIASHHGRCRPDIPALDPDAPRSISVGFARDALLRYARLQRAWGPWGLAWWEALLRSADWSASRRVNSDG
ncbi:MAG: type I-U CRISPR-associated helicase/endonuclease Cas3 [Candidatus Baltobacteraceae bacterium]